MTLDIGTEFADYLRMADKLGRDVDFTDPYAAWQRGLNENATDCSGSSFQRKLLLPGSS